mgnify:CR=1 FL=1
MTCAPDPSCASASPWRWTSVSTSPLTITKPISAKERQRLPRTAGAAKHHGLLPRIADPRAEVAAVAQNSGQCFRQVVKIDDEVRDAGSDE